MQLADAAAARAGFSGMGSSRDAGVAAPPAVLATLSGWGGRDRVPARVARITGVDAARGMVAAARAGAAGGLIARGMGRSYGDAAQLAGGLVMETTGLNSFELDAERGVARADAGVTLAQLLHAAAPAGWVLPVVPGTQHVSVGGAVASDIHGKNHGTVGTFGAHVRRLGLLTAGGEVVESAPGDELFDATVGGMGLTGVVLWAKIRLRRLPSPLLAVDIDRVDDLDAAFSVLDAPGGAHRVAWLDLLGPGVARGVVTRADHVLSDRPGAAQARTTVASRLRIPPRWPGAFLRPEVVRAYNAFRFGSTPRRVTGHLEPFGSHMFPLDALDAWPRLYGRRGFVQYQLVVPRGREDDLRRVLEQLRASSVPCYLAVLKDFGPANAFPLSFPMEGWTLAMDMPGGASGLEALLDGFDEIVAAAGGRVYLAKDARVRPETLAAMYPRLGEWKAARDRADPERRWRSDLALRTGLVHAA